eukprot:scaffold25431_cov137-Amphora_coffeaeformis.AAC.1
MNEEIENGQEGQDDGVVRSIVGKGGTSKCPLEDIVAIIMMIAKRKKGEWKTGRRIGRFTPSTNRTIVSSTLYNWPYSDLNQVKMLIVKRIVKGKKESIETFLGHSIDLI